jgi:uncharacterized membrane protein
MTFVRFLHLLGIGLWMGGVLAALVVVGSQASDPPALRGAAYRLGAKLYSWLVAPGAVLATASGLAITMMVSSSGYGAQLGDPAVATMQVVGLVAGLLEIFVSFPASQRLGRIAFLNQAGELPAAAERLRSRTARVSSTTVVLVLVALYAGVIG